MRIMGRFTSAHIEITAGIGRANLIKYMRALREAGFIRVTQPRVSGRPGSYDVYQLVRNSGPKAPMLWRNGQVFDPNTESVYGEAKEAESQAEVKVEEAVND